MFELGTRRFIWSSKCLQRPSSCAILYCLPSCTGRALGWKWSSKDSTGHRNGMAALHVECHYTTELTPFFLL